jgi:dTDP-4-amino-4,6-dideoxygalactose transaminase
VLGKLRPVGSNVPMPMQVDTVLPWEDEYIHEFTRSGTEALSLAVRLAIADHSCVDCPEVLMPAYGCPDLVAAVVAQGATPVLVDLSDQQTPYMDLHGVEAAITCNTVAIIAVGFLGLPERLEALADVARANALLLIEDSAQCFPPKSIETGCSGADLVVLSFGRGKPINLMGGGALLIRKDHQECFLPILSCYPVIPLVINISWYLKRFLFNLMLSRLSFALLEKIPFLHLGETRLRLLSDINRLDIPPRLVSGGINQYRQRPFWQQVYDTNLSFIDHYGWVRLQAFHGPGDGGSCPRLRYALLAPTMSERDAMIDRLNKMGIGANAFYKQALPEIEGVSDMLEKAFNYPAARTFASRLLTLPCHEDVTDSDIDRVVSCFKAVPVG